MIREIKFGGNGPDKTYKTKENMEKAVAKLETKFEERYFQEHHIRYMTLQNREGRFYPVFVGSIGGLCHLVHEGFCVAN